MNGRFKLLIANFALAATLMFSGGALAFQTPKDTKSTTATKTAATPAASDKDIADAKAKGLVWVNTGTKVYHKDGQFMTEADAQKAGYHAAKPSAVSKKKTTDTKK
jgi:hypothetical protein